MQNQKFPKEKSMNQNPQNRSFNDATTTTKDNKTTYGTKPVTMRTMNIQQIIWWYHRVSVNHHLVAACYHTQLLAATQHLPHYYNMLPMDVLLIVVDIGHKHLKATIQQGPHILVKSPKWQQEALEKVVQGYAETVHWDDIKNDTHPNPKFLPLATVPHKSWVFWAILDLSSQLKINGMLLPSVNKATNPLSLHKSMEQMGQ